MLLPKLTFCFYIILLSSNWGVFLFVVCDVKREIGSMTSGSYKLKNFELYLKIKLHLIEALSAAVPFNSNLFTLGFALPGKFI